MRSQLSQRLCHMWTWGNRWERCLQSVNRRPIGTPDLRGVQAPGQPWAIADFKAEVMVDGRIRADGRGLVFAGGNTIGTALVVTPTGGTAGLKVFATLICENVPTFVQRNTNLAGVPLAANGDFKIDDMLSPPPLPRSSCATPVLLIRSTAGNLTWFAAGIQKFGVALR
jgi:hypothetical protein